MENSQRPISIRAEPDGTLTVYEPDTGTVYANVATDFEARDRRAEWAERKRQVTSLPAMR